MKITNWLIISVLPDKNVMTVLYLLKHYNLFDYQIWGSMEERVYKRRLHSVDELKWYFIGIVDSRPSLIQQLKWYFIGIVDSRPSLIQLSLNRGID